MNFRDILGSRHWLIDIFGFSEWVTIDDKGGLEQFETRGEQDEEEEEEKGFDFCV